MKKTKFGVNQFTKTPPKWLVPVLASILLAVGVAQFIVTGDPSLADELKVRINHYLTGLTMLIGGIAPLFGADVKKPEGHEI